MGKNGRVEELQWRSGEVVVGLNRAMCGWRTAVRGELELTGGNGGGGGLCTRRGLGSLL